jgi:hypothetical protein
LATSSSFDRQAKTRHLTARLVTATLWMLACSIYEVPQRLGGEDPAAGTASSMGGAVSTAGSGGKSAPSSGNGSSSGGSSGGGSELGSGGAAGSGAESGQAGASDAAGGEGGAAGAGGDSCAECAGLLAALVHRYDFEGSGTVVSDRVGSAHGALVGGATLSVAAGKGVVVLSGGATGPYVNLPNALASSLTNATFEAWLTWGGGNAWQRVFDFGDSTSATPEDDPAVGKSYLFVTPMVTDGPMRAVYSLNGAAAGAETRVDAAGALPTTLAQVALVVNAAAGELLLYQNGQKVGEQPFTGALGDINDVNCWLGRSQFEGDVELSGTFHDFRIYDAALTAAQIAASFAGGPDPAFLAE